MSEIDNDFSLVSVLSIADLSNIFEDSISGPDRLTLVRGSRNFDLTPNHIPVAAEELGDRVATLEGYFPAYPRGTTMTVELLKDEVDVIATLIGLRDQASVGYYGNDFFPFVRWDWNDYGVRFNSHPEWWNRLESQLLRKQLRTADIEFEAHRWTTSPAKSGIYWSPAEAEMPVWLWDWFLIGADELRASLELLAATLGVSAGFARDSSEPNSYTVEIEALEDLVRSIIITADAEPERLGVLPNWRTVLTDTVSLLINAGGPLPDDFAEDRWQPLAAAATARAPQILDEEERTRRG